MVAHPRIVHEVAWPRIAFDDRDAAGEQLAPAVVTRPDPDALVLALPRGGVPVAVAVARSLRCELKTLGVRKLPLPDSPEMGFGAVTIDGTRWLNDDVMRLFGVTADQVDLIAEKVRTEIVRRERAYGGGFELGDAAGRDIYLVDDGLATGYTMLAACKTLSHAGAARITVAVPVAPLDSIRRVADVCDALVCLYAQTSLGFAVASFYRFFPDLTDDQVREYLADARDRHGVST